MCYYVIKFTLQCTCKLCQLFIIKLRACLMDFLKTRIIKVRDL